MTSVNDIAFFLCEKNLKGRERSLMYGNMGIAIFLMCLWKQTKKDKFYRKASELVVDAFDFLTRQIHVHRLAPRQADLSFDTGIGGIAWGINYLILNELIECDFDDTMCLIDDFIFRQMIDCIYSNNVNDIRLALQIGLYAIERSSRFSQEYVRRFVKEWRNRLISEADKSASIWFIGNEIVPLFLLNKISLRHPDFEYVFEIQRLYRPGTASGTPEDIDIFVRNRLLSLLEYSNENDDFRKWFTPSRGIYALHYGLKDGLAGIALAQMEPIPGIVPWSECLFT